MTKEALKPTCSLILLSAPSGRGYLPQKLALLSTIAAWGINEFDGL